MGGECPRYPERGGGAASGQGRGGLGPGPRDPRRGSRPGLPRRRRPASAASRAEPSPASRERPQTALVPQARPYLEMRQLSQRRARTTLGPAAAVCALPLPLRALPLAGPPRAGGGACAAGPRGAGEASCAGATPVASETARCFRGRGRVVPRPLVGVGRAQLLSPPSRWCCAGGGRVA